jgi:maltodextrin utilization protein YvdJ
MLLEILNIRFSTDKSFPFSPFLAACFKQNLTALCKLLKTFNVENLVITNKLPLNTTKTKTILISGKRLKAKLTPENQTPDIKLNDDSLEQAHSEITGL